MDHNANDDINEKKAQKHALLQLAQEKLICNQIAYLYHVRYTLNATGNVDSSNARCPLVADLPTFTEIAERLNKLFQSPPNPNIELVTELVPRKPLHYTELCRREHKAFQSICNKRVLQMSAKYLDRNQYYLIVEKYADRIAKALVEKNEREIMDIYFDVQDENNVYVEPMLKILEKSLSLMKFSNRSTSENRVQRLPMNPRSSDMM